MLDGGLLPPAWRPGDADDIEAHGTILSVVCFDVVHGGARDLALLARVDRLPRFTVITGNSRLHFDKDKEIPLLGDEINFTERASIGMKENAVSSGAQEASRLPFPSST